MHKVCVKQVYKAFKKYQPPCPILHSEAKGTGDFCLSVYFYFYKKYLQRSHLLFQFEVISIYIYRYRSIDIDV